MMNFGRRRISHPVPDFAYPKQTVSLLNNKNINDSMPVVMRLLCGMRWDLKSNQLIVALAVQRTLKYVGCRKSFVP